MLSEKKINVALVGLSFGAEFIPIYQKHPNANQIAICQRDPQTITDSSRETTCLAYFSSLIRMSLN